MRQGDICKKFSDAVRFLKMGAAAVVFLVSGTIQTVAQTSQYCDAWTNMSSLYQANYCSPSQAYYTISIMFDKSFDMKRVVRAGVDWGDGSPREWLSYPSDFNNRNGTIPNTVIYDGKNSLGHIYHAEADCHIKTTVLVEFTDGICELTGVINATVWTTDNDSRGNGELVFVTEEDKGSVNEYLVCAGQAIDVSFWDLSTLACLTVPYTGAENAFIYDMRIRNTQYVYGIANGSSDEFPAPAPLIPEVTVGTVKVTDLGGGGHGVLTTGSPYEQTYKTFPQPQPGTFQVTDAIEDETPRITVPADVTIAGQVFTIELRNWNFCNSYPGNAPVTTTARIVVVDAPPPPSPATVEFCHENHYSALPSYTITLTHSLPSQFTPGEYRWYADNNGDPGAEIRTKPYTDRTFNPFSTTDVPSSVQRIPTDAAGKPIPGEYIYWVDYKYDDRTSNPPKYVCETNKVPITWVIRSDISDPPSALTGVNSSTGKMEGCSGETVTLTYPNAPGTETYGGNTQYFWQVTSVIPGTTTPNAIITRNTGDRGQSASMVLTGDPDATAVTKTQTVTIRVHREWVDELITTPANRGVCRYAYPSAPAGEYTQGCDHCPGDYVQFTFIINPLPKAALGGGGEICADETGLELLSLTGLGGGKQGGSPSQYNLKVTLESSASDTQAEDIKYSGTTGSINIVPDPFPANGTYTTYTITRVEDVITGCISTAPSTKITGSAAITKRGKLTAPTFSTVPPNYLCPNTSYSWELPAITGLQPATPPKPAPALAAQYRWSWYGGSEASLAASGTPTITANSGPAAFPDGTSKDMAVYSRYTTQAAQSGLVDKYCPSDAVTQSHLVIPLPTVTLSPASQTLCNDEASVTVTLNLTGFASTSDGGWTVEWRLMKSGTQVALATNPATPNPFTVAGNTSGTASEPLTIYTSDIPTPVDGDYTFEIVSVKQAANTNCAAVATPSVNFTIRKIPTVTIITADQEICEKSNSKPITLDFGGDTGGSFSITYTSSRTGATIHTPESSWLVGNTLIIPKEHINTGSATTAITITSVTQTVSGKPCTATVSVPYTITTIEPTSAGGDKATCAGAITLSATTPTLQAGQYVEWVKVNPSDPITVTTPSSPSSTVTMNNPTAFGVYRLRWVIFDSGGNEVGDCADEIAVTFGTTPQQSLITGENAVCGLQVALTGTTTTGAMKTWEKGTWTLVSSPAGASVVSPAPFHTRTVDGNGIDDDDVIVRVDAYGTYTFQWIVESASCPGAVPATKTVTFHPIPNTQTPVIVPDPACQGDTVTLTFADNNSSFPVPITYSWSFNGAPQLPITSPPNNQVTVTAPYHAFSSTQSYNGWVRGTSYPDNTNLPLGCAGDQEPFAVRVFPKPVLSDIGAQTLCPGNSFTLSLASGLSGNPPVTFTWEGVDNLGDPSPHPNSGLPPNAGMADGSVTVSTTPYQHSLTSIPTTAKDVTGTHLIPETGRLKVTAYANGCPSDPKTFAVTVNPVPTIEFSATEAAYCSNIRVDDTNAMRFWSSDVPDASFTWKYEYSAAIVGDLTMNASRSARSIAGTTPQQWTTENFTTANNTGGSDRIGKISVTSTALCSDTASFRIIVRPQPRINAIDADLYRICSPPTGGAAFPAITPVPAVTYSSPYLLAYTFDQTGDFGTGSLSGSSYPGIVNPENLTNNDFTGKVTINPSLTWGVAGESCPGTPVEVDLTGYRSPVINPIASQARCSGLSFDQISFSSSNIAPDEMNRYGWSFAGDNVGRTGSGESNSIPFRMTGFQAAPNTSGADLTATVTVNAYSSRGCQSKDPVTYTYTVFPRPEISQIGAAPQVFCPEQSVTVPAFSSNITTSATVTYTWSMSGDKVGEGLPSVFPQTGNIPSPFTGAENFSGGDRKSTVTVTALSSDGCAGVNSMNFDLTLRPAPKMDPVVIPEFCPNLLISGGIPITTNVSGSVVSWTRTGDQISAAPVNAGDPAQLLFSSTGGIPEFITDNPVSPSVASSLVKATATSAPGTYNGVQYPGCASSDTVRFSIVVKPTPDIRMPADTFYCTGESTGTISFSSSFPGITYHWRRSGDYIGLSNTTGTNVIPSFSTVNDSPFMLESRTSTFLVYSALNGCDSKPDTLSMTVMPRPQLDTYDALTVCAGDPVTPDPFALRPPENPDKYTFIPGYRWTASGVFKEMQLTPLSFPASANQFPASGNGNLPAFVGDTAKTGYAPADNDLWGTTPKNVNVSVTPQVSYVYPSTSIHVGAVKTCSATTPQPVYITVNPLPVTKIMQPDNNCVKSEMKALYQLENANPGSYWFWEDGVDAPGIPPASAGKGPVISLPDPFPAGWKPDSTLTYQVYQYPADATNWRGYISVRERNWAGCWGDVAKLDLTVTAAPIVYAGRDRTICRGDTVVMTGTVLNFQPPLSDYGFEWFPGGAIEGKQDSITVVMRPFDNMTVDFRAAVNGCYSDPSRVILKVIAPPNMPNVPPVTLCETDPLWKMDVINPATMQSNEHMHWLRMFETSLNVWDTAPISNSDSISVSMKLTGVHPEALPAYPLPWSDPLAIDTVLRYQVFMTRHDAATSLICSSPPTTTTLTVRRTPDEPFADHPFYCEGSHPLSRYPLNATSTSANAPYINWFDSVGNVAGSGQRILVHQPKPSREIAGAPPTYEPFTYYVSASNGYCSSPLKEVFLTVYPKPELNFILRDSLNMILNPGDGGCSEFLVNAENISPTGIYADYNWIWTVNDTVPAPLNGIVRHFYKTAVGSTVPEPVWLKLSGVSNRNIDSETGEYCRNDTTQMLIISPGVKANIHATTYEGCDPLQVLFSSTSSGAYYARWYWDRELSGVPRYPGNAANPGTLETPDMSGGIVPKTFENKNSAIPREYHLYLVAHNDACYDHKDTIITVYPVPESKFSHNTTSKGICPPDSVMFTNLSDLGLTNGPNTRYVWNFGDGAPDTTSFNSVTYHRYESLNASAQVPYNVMLTAFNQFTPPGLICSSTSSETVYVNPQVLAAFTGDSAGCSPMTARFQSQSVGAVSWHNWDFDDPNDTRPGTGSNPSHQFINSVTHDDVKEYHVKLTAGNSYCRDSVWGYFYLYPKPIAIFDVDPPSGCQPLDVTFNNLSNSPGKSNPMDGTTLYSYDFNDSQSCSFRDPDSTVIHRYNNALGTNMTMNPTLTVRNKWECVTTVGSTPVVIFPLVKADFEIEDSIGCAPLMVRFRNGSMGYSSYRYAFGDGFIDSGTQTSSGGLNAHSYKNPSMYRDTVYNVTLTVTSGARIDHNGNTVYCSDSVTRKVTVLSQPVAEFLPESPYPADYLYPVGQIEFYNQIPLPDRDSLIYLWSHVERSSGLLTNFYFSEYPPPQPFRTWGTFDVTQHVTAPNNICTDSKTITIRIVPPGVIPEFQDVVPDCMPYEVEFVNESKFVKDDKAYLWEFGDGTSSNAKDPKHVFTDAGTYIVTLTAWGEMDNDKKTMQKVVLVHPLPQAGFQVHPNFLWVGQPLRSFNTTAHQYSNGVPYDVWYRWDWGDNTPIDTIEQPSHMYLKAGSYSITLTVGTYTDPQCISSLTLYNAVDLESAGDIIMPNIFKPHPTGEPSDIIVDRGYKNYLFFPPVLTPVRKYHFVVYSRAGQLLFETNDPNRGWNGYFRGRLCDEGVYVYKIQGVYETGQSFQMMGDITLLR